MALKRAEVNAGIEMARVPGTTARNADPLRKREEELRREQVRIEKNSERLVTAYQQGLVTLSQLRQRMPALQKQAQAAGSKLQSLEMAAVDQAKYLQLAESLTGFLSKLRTRAETLDIGVRQQIVRLVVKESWWVATQLHFAIRYLFLNPGQDQTDQQLHRPVSLDQGRIQVGFCVRGVKSMLLEKCAVMYVFC